MFNCILACLYNNIVCHAHYISESGLPFNVLASYEINPVAVDVYCSNFPGTSKPRNILGLTVEELTRLSPDIIMMSPPCQPFTRYCSCSSGCLLIFRIKIVGKCCVCY